VVCGIWTGGFAERMVAKQWKCVRLPAAVDFESGTTTARRITPCSNGHAPNSVNRCSLSIGVEN
jgi:hypothetical protein